MAVQNFNVDKSMVTCNLLTDMKIDLWEKKRKEKQPDSTRFCHLIL